MRPARMERRRRALSPNGILRNKIKEYRFQGKMEVTPNLQFFYDIHT